jgi:hypothetical protein
MGKLNKHFSKENKLTRRFMKIWLTSPIIKGMQIKSTRQHLTPVIMVTIKKQVNGWNWRTSY